MKTQVEKSKLKIILVNKLKNLQKLPFGAGWMYTYSLCVKYSLDSVRSI